VTGVAFGQLPDGSTLLASSSWDHTVRLWDPAAGVARECLNVAPSFPEGMAFAGTSLIVGCRDGIIALELSRTLEQS
jgi:WD40 repeat protein